MDLTRIIKQAHHMGKTQVVRLSMVISSCVARINDCAQVAGPLLQTPEAPPIAAAKKRQSKEIGPN